MSYFETTVKVDAETADDLASHGLMLDRTPDGNAEVDVCVDYNSDGVVLKVVAYGNDNKQLNVTNANWLPHNLSELCLDHLRHEEQMDYDAAAEDFYERQRED